MFAIGKEYFLSQNTIVTKVGVGWIYKNREFTDGKVFWNMVFIPDEKHLNQSTFWEQHENHQEFADATRFTCE